jgi:hypothetical protein
MIEFTEDPCVNCIVIGICNHKCDLYYKALYHISRNLGKWDSQTIRKYRQSARPNFLHEVEHEVKRWVEHAKTYRIPLR